MNIYHYHPETKKYLGNGVADVDPMDSNNHLIPANATTVECTLEETEGFIRVFNEETEQWEQEAVLTAEPLGWADNRRLNYPPIGDQLDDLFRAGAFSTEMTAQIQQVKDDYPKE